MIPFRRQIRRLVALANEASPVSTLGTAALVNETNPDDWMLLVPYGEYANGSVVQLVDREAGRRLAEYVNSLATQTLRGVPIYIGHPDHPEFVGRPGHQDRRAYGWLKDLQARDDGIYVNVRWGAPGRELLANAAYRWFSAHWLAVPVPERGANYVRPVRLRSIGLTNEPNIPSPAIANEATPAPSDTEKTMELKQLLALLGLPETATADEAAAAINALKAEAAKVQPAEQAKMEAETAAANAKTAAQQAEAARTAAETALANERKARAEQAADHAIANGRLTVAERPARVAALLATTTPEGWAAIANATAPTGPKGTATSDGLAALANETTDARLRFRALVNERMGKGENYDAAWSAVSATSEGKALLAKMQKTA